MAHQIVKIKRGQKSNLPIEGIEGQPYFAMDTSELYIGMGEGQQLKKIATQQKVITFISKDCREGIFGPCIKFPYSGRIVSVNANCNYPGDMASILTINKISEQDYKNEIDSWSPILEDGMIIPSGKKFNDEGYTFRDNVVNMNDYFRLGMLYYSNLRDIVVEIIIELQDI